MGDLRVTVEHDVRIDANGARVHVTLRAQSSLAATAAAKKVAEVRALVESLSAVGVPDEAIDLLEWTYDEFEASIPATADAMRMARRTDAGERCTLR